MAIPEFTYTKDVPQGTQKQSVTQAPIQSNFQAIKELVEIDHEAFNLANNVGKHKRVSLQVQAPAPTFDIPAKDVGLYNFLNPTTTKNELYVHRQTNNSPAEVPFTASKMSNTTMNSCVNGWSYLPSGLLIKWGEVVAPADVVAIAPAVVSGGPAFNKVFIAYVTPHSSGPFYNFSCGIYQGPSTTTGAFTAYCKNWSLRTVIDYLVIGV